MRERPRISPDRLAACCAAVIAVPVLIGWHVHGWRIVRPDPAVMPMAYNTALSIAACAATVLTGRGRRSISALVFALAVLNLAEYAMGRAFGIDTAIVTPPAWLWSGDAAGRMAPNTALSLLCLAISLALTHGDGNAAWRRQLRALCLSAGAALPIVAGVGYFTGIPAGYTWVQLVPMAPHTAAALAILATGLLWQLGVTGWSERGQSIPVWLPIPAVLTIATVGLLLFRAMEAEHRVDAQRELQKALAQVASRIEHEVDERASMANRLAHRVSRGERPGTPAWAADLANLKQDFLGLSSIDVVDDASTDVREPRLIPQDSELHVVVPLEKDGLRVGRLTARFDRDTLLREIVPAGSGDVVIERDGQRVFGDASLGVDPMTQPLRIFGEGWRLLAKRADPGHSSLSSVVLISVFVLASLVGIVLHLARSADARRREALQVSGELNRRQHLLNLIRETLPVGLFIADARGEIASGNAEGQRIWGGAPLVGSEEYGHFKAWRADSGQALRAEDWAMNRAIRSGEPTLNELLDIEAFDGTRKTVLHSAVPIREADGTIVGGVVVIQDITARVTAERELVLRTRELERSNADLAQFAYIASHDLQEPLRMVSSYTQLLARRYRGQLDAAADEFIHFAVDGAQRMQQLIDALLQYSRVGTQERTLGDVDMNEVLASAVANLGVAIQESSAVVTHDSLPAVTGDRVQLTQLLQNLIGNALKFRGDDPPRIHVSASRAVNPVFSVEDNGIGIEPEYAQRVFEVFQRLHSRDRYPGTGIGLAVCRRIVDRHGGIIWVEPRVDRQGCVFRFLLQGTAAESAA